MNHTYTTTPSKACSKICVASVVNPFVLLSLSILVVNMDQPLGYTSGRTAQSGLVPDLGSSACAHFNCLA